MNNNIAKQILGMALKSKPCMNNDIFANAVNLCQQGRSKELWELVDNLCKNSGTSRDEVKKNIGL